MYVSKFSKLQFKSVNFGIIIIIIIISTIY